MFCRLAVLLTVFQLFPNLSAASLDGSVSDPTGAVISNAWVRVIGRDGTLHYSGRTASDGRFLAFSLAPGSYLVEAGAEGFVPTVRAVRVDEASPSAVQLSLDVAGLEETVLVTAAGTAQTIEEVGKAFSLVDGAELKSRNSVTLADALATVPGLRVYQSGGPQAFTNIRIRGLRNQDTSVLLDGMRIRDSSTIEGDSTSLLQDIMLLNTRQIEVLRGSSSSVHGTHAVGGVVNLISDEGGWPNRGGVRIEGGGLGLFRASATALGGTRGGRLSFSAGALHQSIQDGVEGVEPSRNTAVQGKVQFHLSPGLVLVGRFWGSDSYSELLDSPFAVQSNVPVTGDFVPGIPLPSAKRRVLEQGGDVDYGDATFVPGLRDPDSNRKARLFSGNVGLHHQVTPSASYTVRYQTVQTSRVFKDGPSGVSFEPVSAVSSDFQGRIDTFQVRTDFLVGQNHLWSAGFEFEEEKADSADSAADLVTTTRATQQSQTLFFQDQMSYLGGNLQVALAGRGQWFQLGKPTFGGDPGPYETVVADGAFPVAWTADGSVSYRVPSSGTRLRAHVGNGYRVPSLYNRFGSYFFLGSFSYLGDPGLRPERSISADVGLDQGLAGNRLQVATTYFYTRLRDIIYFDFSGAIEPSTDPHGRFSGYANGDGGLARGVELGAAYQPSPRWSLRASYTFTNADEAAAYFTNFTSSLGVARHKVDLFGDWTVNSRLNLGFESNVMSDYFMYFYGVDRPYRFEGMFRTNLFASFRIFSNDSSSVRLQGKIFNIFDEDYYENGFQTPGIYLTGGLAVEF